MSMLVSDLVTETIESFRSYVREQPPTTALTAPIGNTDTTFVVADGMQIGKGLHQIDDEMVSVRSVDRTTNTVTLEPWGRGQSGSQAVSHSAGAKVTQAPNYPRTRVRDLLSGTIQEIFPDLFAVALTTLDINPAKVNYSLPADTWDVISVQFQPVGPSLSWIPVSRWRQNKTPTGVEVEVLSRVQPGLARVRVMYKKNPPGHLEFTDDLATLGYPESLRDVIVLGGTARLAAFVEGSRVQNQAQDPQVLRIAVPAGSAVNLSKYLYQLFRQRLEDEAMNLKARYPAVAHFTR